MVLDLLLLVVLVITEAVGVLEIHLVDLTETFLEVAVHHIMVTHKLLQVQLKKVHQVQNQLQVVVHQVLIILSHQLQDKVMVQQKLVIQDSY